MEHISDVTVECNMCKESYQMNILKYADIRFKRDRHYCDLCLLKLLGKDKI